MAEALCDQISGLNLGGSATAGLGGAAKQMRGTEEKGGLRERHFTFTIPAAGAGSATGDTIKLPGMKVSDRIYMLRVTHGAMGAGVQLSIGKKDSNNAANTDPTHYSLAVDCTNPGTIDANANMGEQVGDDASGDPVATGNAINPGAPGGGYGSGPINPIITITGAPTAAAKINGFYFYAGDET